MVSEECFCTNGAACAEVPSIKAMAEIPMTLIMASPDWQFAV
jgi:hypothetical protein